MLNVAFVCLGNICRSPMAELIFKKILNEKNLAKNFNVSSFATSCCEVGNVIYPPAKRTLEKHAVEGTHVSRQLTLNDVKNNDYILVMDSENLRDVLNLTNGKYAEKIFKLLSFADRPDDVADPWYTRDFEKTYQDIVKGCHGFLNYVLNEKS